MRSRSHSAASVAQLQCAQYEAQLRKSRDRERELRDAMAALDRDHTKLLSYAAGIEAALDEEREHRELAGLEMACLQEQVDLLQATVDQLVATGASPPDP